MQQLSSTGSGDNDLLAEMFRDQPVFSPTAEALFAQRIAEAAAPLAAHCQATGQHFGIITISYRELIAMMRVFGPDVVGKIHLRVIEILRQELPSHCFVITGQNSLVLFLMDVGRDECFQLGLRLESILCGSFRIDGFDYGVNFIFSTGEYPGLSQDADLSLAEFHRLFAVYEDENYDLYKETGNRVFMIDPERFEVLTRWHELDQQMRDDFAAGRFHLHYQPRVDLVTGQIVGAEALMRWNSSHAGPISPGTFIPIAEKNGFIHSLTPFALRTVAQSLPTMCERFGPDFTVGANLSGICIRSRNLVSIVKECMSEFGLARGGIELEITESQLIDQRHFVIDQLNDLRKAGVATALDDFGTGYSSLHVLTTIPLDYLKIDRSFVSSLGRQPREKHVAIARSIAEMGKACGLKVIAEGMETAEEVRILVEEIGCPLGQGFYFSKPVPLEQFLNLPDRLGA